jgi:hypothetical protein
MIYDKCTINLFFDEDNSHDAFINQTDLIMLINVITRNNLSITYKSEEWMLIKKKRTHECWLCLSSHFNRSILEVRHHIIVIVIIIITIII